MKNLLFFFISLLFFRTTQAQFNPETITIGSQVWMKTNLDVSTYRNGDLIPNVTDPTAWGALTSGAWCWYDNDSATYAAIYGKLYNWYAVNDPRGLAPAGWHIPSDTEWTTLYKYSGGNESGEGALKEKGKTHWHSPNLKATNSSGFTGLPGGWRDIIGRFKSIGYFGIWWSATEYSAKEAWVRQLEYLNGFLTNPYLYKKEGFSVRCVRD